MPKRKLQTAVEIPSNLNALSKNDLIELVLQLDAERQKSSKKLKTNEPSPDKLKKSLTKKLTNEIKKAKVRTQNAKPWVEVHEGVSLSYAQNLVKDIGTQTKVMNYNCELPVF